MKKYIILFIALVVLCFSLSACSKKKHLANVDLINEKISLLPIEVRKKDEATIAEIEALYSKLPEKYQAEVKNYQAIINAKIRLAGFKKGALDMIERINQLPSVENVAIVDKFLIADVKAIYDELTPEVQDYVENYHKIAELEAKITELEKKQSDQAIANQVIYYINSLPDSSKMTKDDIELVIEARRRYEALDDDIKAYVTNLAVLEELEAYIDVLLADEVYDVYFYLAGGRLEGTTYLDKENVYKATYKGSKVLDTPTKLNYIFLGFYDNKECVGTPVTKVYQSMTLYACWLYDNTYIATKDILNCVSDVATSSTYDNLVLENDEATFTWKSSDPDLYAIVKNCFGKVVMENQTHQSKKVTITVTINYKNGSSEDKSKEITVEPILFADLPSTPVATYFSVSAISSYARYNERYKEEGTLFSETTKEALDILYYAFIEIAADGSCYFGSDKYIEEVRELRKHNVRIVASVSGTSTAQSRLFATLTKDATKRLNFVNNLLNLIDEYKLDGIDIDWESTSEAPVIASQMSDLMRDLREQMNIRQAPNGTPYFLSAAVPASSWGAAQGRFDFVSLNEYLDYINLMSYDMNREDITSHLSPLYPSKKDRGYGFGCHYGANLLSDGSHGFSKNKILIGCAAYGKAYQITGAVTDGEYPGLGVKATLTSLPGIDGSFATGTLFGNAILALIATGKYQKYTEYDGNNLVGSYLYNKEDNIFVTYDSEEAIIAKYQYAKKIEGMGMMCWCYSEDPSDSVINAIYKAINS